MATVLHPAKHAGTGITSQCNHTISLAFADLPDLNGMLALLHGPTAHCRMMHELPSQTCLMQVQDATWITASNSLKCTNADEVLLLLKSSDRIAHDICNAFDGCKENLQEEVRYVLVLKKHYDLKPEREFRCFIKGHDLIGEHLCMLIHVTGRVYIDKIADKLSLHMV